MELRVVLVRPLHDLNVGSACRAMKNFGCTDLRLVAPEARLGFQARLYAKHSEEVLSGAKAYDTLAEAVEGCDAIVGTTGAPARFASKLRFCVPLPRLPGKLKGCHNVALVFGSESNGLTEEESKECDFFATIPASPEHAVLNLSHAVAVVLYELYGAPSVQGKRASRPDLKQINALFTARLGSSVRNKARVAKAFANMLARSDASHEEARALLAGFAGLQSPSAGKPRGKRVQRKRA
jgi:TrmH family RNA methyltransferase